MTISTFYIIYGFKLSRQEMQTSDELKQAFQKNFTDDWDKDDDDSIVACWNEIFEDFCDEKTFTHNDTEFIMDRVTHEQTDNDDYNSEFIVGILLSKLTVCGPEPNSNYIDLTPMNKIDDLKNHEFYGSLIKDKDVKIWINQDDCGCCS